MQLYGKFVLECNWLYTHKQVQDLGLLNAVDQPSASLIAIDRVQKQEPSTKLYQVFSKMLTHVTEVVMTAKPSHAQPHYFEDAHIMVCL